MQQSQASPAQLQQELESRLAADATELATASEATEPDMQRASSPSQLEPKHLAHVTSKLKSRYKLLPKDMQGAQTTGVNMSLLAYAGPYSAIGQSIREPLQSAQTALKMTAEMAAEQGRVQRAAAALAQRKAFAARAAEEALWQGKGLKGSKHKQLPSAAFVSQSRQQAQRPSSASSSTNQKVGPGWYHVRHTALDKHMQSARVNSSNPSSSRPSSARAEPSDAMHTNLQRRHSMRSTASAFSTDQAATEVPLHLVLPHSRPSTTPLSSPLGPSNALARSATNMTLNSPTLGKTLGRSTTAAFDPAFFGKTLGRTETNLTAAVFGKTLGRTNTNVASYGKTLGRTGTMMSGMTLGRTLGPGHGFGETMRHDFGATQAAAPPLAIDPLITAMLQKAANQVPWPKARATSPAFEAVGRKVDAAAQHLQQGPSKGPKQISLSQRDAVIRKNLHLVVPFQLQVNAREHSIAGQGRAHLAPGMHFQQPPPTYSGQHLKAGHPTSMQHLDFCKQTPRPSVSPQTIAEEEAELDIDNSGSEQDLRHARPMSSKGPGTTNRHKQRPASAWEARRQQATKEGARKLRAASASARSAKAGMDTGAPLQAWMVPCLHKQPAGAATLPASEQSETSWQHWTAEQANLQPSIPPIPHPARPASAQLHRQLPSRSKAEQRPASAAAYLRLTAQMPFPAHKQPSARAHGCNSPEAAPDALGNMLASIAESAAALDASAPVSFHKQGNRKAQGTAVHGNSPADNLQSSVAISSPPDKPASSSNLGPSPVLEDSDVTVDQQDAAVHMSQSAAQVESVGAPAEALQLSNAAALVRPPTAQPGVQSPGTFLRHARPQSAAAANVASYTGPRAFWKGSQKRPGSSRPRGGVQDVASHTQGKKVHGGTMSLTSREEALHSMRPLKQTQGHTAPVVEGYWDAAYDPNQEAQGHRFRAPSWTLPPNRAIPHWRGTVTGHRKGKQAAAGKPSVQQQEWQKWVQYAAISLHDRT